MIKAKTMFGKILAKYKAIEMLFNNLYRMFQNIKRRGSKFFYFFQMLKQNNCHVMSSVTSYKYNKIFLEQYIFKILTLNLELTAYPYIIFVPSPATWPTTYSNTPSIQSKIGLYPVILRLEFNMMSHSHHIKN